MLPENVGPGASLITASPPPQTLFAPEVLPVTGKMEVPSVGSAPGPQTPPLDAFVCHQVAVDGVATGKPTTEPK